MYATILWSDGECYINEKIKSVNIGKEWLRQKVRERKEPLTYQVAIRNRSKTLFYYDSNTKKGIN